MRIWYGIAFLIGLLLGSLIFEARAMESDLGKIEVLRVDHCEMPLCMFQRQTDYVTIPKGADCDSLMGVVLGMTWVKSNHPGHVLYNVECVTMTGDDL